MSQKKLKNKDHFKPETSGGLPRCQAFSRTRPGEQCLRPAKPGFRVCEYHGAGKGNKNGGRPPEPDKPESMYNPESKRFKEAKFGAYDSEHIPKRLRARFTRLMNNPAIFQVDGELLILQARLEERLESLPEQQPMEGIRQAATGVLTGYTRLKDAMRQQNAEALRQALTDTDSALEALAAAIQAEPDERDAWSDILGLMRHKSGLVEQARRHRVEAKTMIGIEEFAEHHKWVQATIITLVHDPAVKSEIARRFRVKAAQVFGLDATTSAEEPTPPALPPVPATQLN